MNETTGFDIASSFFDTEALRSLAFGGPWSASDFAAFSFPRLNMSVFVEAGLVW